MENPMGCTIKWNTLSIDDWEKRFSLIPRSNILQSYDYAKIASPFFKHKARWGLIEIDGREAGLVQLFEIGILWNLFHAVMLDRGPAWFEGFGAAMHVKRFFDEFNRQFPKRFGRRRRILPEIEDGPSAQKMLSGTGMIRREDRKGYETIWLDLTPDEDTLLANLKSNWRNKLNKANREGLSVEWDTDGYTLAWLMPIYATDKMARDYAGLSPEFLQKYAALLISQQKILIARAMKDGNPQAFTVFALHGRSATYLAGWSSDAGRESAAHTLLLWEGVRNLKHRHIKELDLGGINDESAQGIKTFKEGLGGKNIRYLGHYY